MLIFNKASEVGSLCSCPCCGFWTLNEQGAYNLCPVCYWEDDGQDEQDKDEVRGGPNANLSLTQARLNFDEFWACERRFIDKVRKPTGDEI